MKKLLVATTVAMALSAAAHAADSTAQLKVQGVLTNDACTPTLSGGGTVDFGTTYVNTLSSTESNQLGKKDITLSIQCSSPTKVSWSIEDNVGQPSANVDIINPGFIGDYTISSPGLFAKFGIGKTAGGVSIGAYSVALDTSNTTADTTAARVIRSSLDTDNWGVFMSGKSTDYITSDNEYRWSVSPSSGSTVPEAFTNAVFPMRVALAVDKTSTLAITDDTPIAGQATITLHYL